MIFAGQWTKKMEQANWQFVQQHGLQKRICETHFEYGEPKNEMAVIDSNRPLPVWTHKRLMKKGAIWHCNIDLDSKTRHDSCKAFQCSR